MKYYATKISDNMSETPEGFLLCMNVPIGRLGVMDYAKGETPLEPGPDGITKISRDEEELFRPETIASFEGKPVTINHPEDFVDPENWKHLGKGTMQHVRRGEADLKDDLVCDLLIMDALAISLVKNGLREVSCGYECEYVETGKGTGKQTNIIGNHLALVESGRAGPSYAINDHKGVFKMSKKLGEKIKSLFSKAVDEAMSGEETPVDDKAGAYDELVKMCADLSAKVEAFKPKDEAPPEKKDKEEKPAPKKEGEDEEVAPSLEDRLKALETAVSKLLEAKSGDEDPEEGEEMSDEEGEEEESEDDEMEMTGDTASRAEILAPGIKATKDVKSKALKIAYGTKEGKKVIDALTGGKAPAFDSKEKVDTLFIAASELLKSDRSEGLARTKRTKDFSSVIFDQDSVMTAEKMNELNAKRYAKK